MHDLFSNFRFQNGFEGQDTGAMVYIKNVFIKILTSMIKFTMFYSMAVLYYYCIRLAVIEKTAVAKRMYKNECGAIPLPRHPRVYRHKQILVFTRLVFIS